MTGTRLPPPPFWRVPYFDAAMRRPDRRNITPEAIQAVLATPIQQVRQSDGRVRYWGWDAQTGKWLRVIVEPDGETILNAFWDRGFKP